MAGASPSPLSLTGVCAACVRVQIKAKGRTKREQTRVAITTFFDSLGDSLSSFVDDKQKLATTVGSLVALAAGVYVTREGARVAGRYIERKLGTPSLVRETSKSTGQYAVTKRLARMLGLEKPVTFDDVVLAGTLDTRVSRLAVSTRNTKNNNATFRNALFYGPPGTGKTMVAKRLARSAGLDYAVRVWGCLCVCVCVRCLGLVWRLGGRVRPR